MEVGKIPPEFEVKRILLEASKRIEKIMAEALIERESTVVRAHKGTCALVKDPDGECDCDELLP